MDLTKNVPKVFYHYMGNWAFWDISVLRHMIIVVDTQGTSNWKSIDDNKIYPSLNRTKIFTFQKRLFSATPLQKHLSAAMELLKEMIHADSRCIPLKHGRP